MRGGVAGAFGRLRETAGAGLPAAVCRPPGGARAGAGRPRCRGLSGDGEEACACPREAGGSNKSGESPRQNRPGGREGGRARGAGRGRRERLAGGSRAPALTLARRAHTGGHPPAHARPCPAGPGAGPHGGDLAGRTHPAPEPAPTSAPLRSAAARLARRPRQSGRKMVNDRWKTMGGASQLEDRPRDKPQVRVRPGRGDRGPARLARRWPLQQAG